MPEDVSIAQLDRRLRALEDERAIQQTLYAYGHALDYGDEPLWRSVWTDDAVLHWPWQEPIVGREQLLAAFRGHTHAPDKFHKHFMVEPRIALDGDEARVQCLYARLDRNEQGQPYLRSFGRYRDLLARGADGRWRIRERALDNEAHEFQPQWSSPV